MRDALNQTGREIYFSLCGLHFRFRSAKLTSSRLELLVRPCGMGPGQQLAHIWRL